MLYVHRPTGVDVLLLGKIGVIVEHHGDFLGLCWVCRQFLNLKVVLLAMKFLSFAFNPYNSSCILEKTASKVALVKCSMKFS